MLPGPQGTLFGASSQAGTVRYITKKPDASGFEAGFTSGIASTKSGDMSNNAEAFINIPVTSDLAFRAALYSVNRGGYIDNVYGEFTLDPAVNTLVAEGVKALPDDTVYNSAHNTHLIEENFNDSFYKGGRFGLKYDINTDWELLVQHTEQELGAMVYLIYDPEVGDLEVQRFFPDTLKDAFSQTAWTATGTVEELEMVTGAFWTVMLSNRLIIRVTIMVEDTSLITLVLMRQTKLLIVNVWTQQKGLKASKNRIDNPRVASRATQAKATLYCRCVC